MSPLRNLIEQKAALETEIAWTLGAGPEKKRSLEQALARSALLPRLASRRLGLSAKVLRIETPCAGLAFETRIVVRYQLFDRASGQLVLTREIHSQGTVPVAAAAPGGSQSTQARTLAVQSNVEEFIHSLQALAA